MKAKNNFGIPQKTLDVTRARYQLTQLLRQLRSGPRIYLITQSGKAAGALVNLEWLGKLFAQARGQRPFSLFGQAAAAEDWEQTLAQLRAGLATRAVGRYTQEKG